MNRILTLTSLAFSCILVACATQIDDPLPDSTPNETSDQDAQTYALDASNPIAPPVVELTRNGTDIAQPVVLPHPALPAIANPRPVTWGDLLVCIACVADRYKAQLPAPISH
jgi:hypothetical protein